MPKLSDCTLRVGAAAVQAAYFRGQNLIGAPDPLAPILTILRNVGGLLYMPGPANRGAADGTGPVAAPGDPIGFVDELAAGINDATQASTASRPILRQVGSGYYWEFDGSNDALELSTVPAQWAQDLVVMAVGARGGDGVQAKLYEQLPSAGGGAIVMRLSSGGVVVQVTDASSGVRTVTAGSAPVGTELVAELEIMAGVVRAYNNGTPGSIGAIPTGTAPVFAVTRFGAPNATTPTLQGPTIILPGAAATNITAQDRQTLRQWLFDYRDTLSGVAP